MKYFLYILKSQSAGKYYTGILQNPERRLEYYNSFEKGFTSGYRPWEIVFTKKRESKEETATIGKKIIIWKSKKMIEKIMSKEIELRAFGSYPDKSGCSLSTHGGFESYYGIN